MVWDESALSGRYILNAFVFVFYFRRTNTNTEAIHGVGDCQISLGEDVCVDGR